jgi:hypothetical protein
MQRTKIRILSHLINNFGQIGRRGVVLAAFSLGMGLAGGSAYARDMQGRFGLGFNRQFSNINTQNAVPGISIKYALNRVIALEAIAGITTASPGNAVAAMKFYSNIFSETNLNFYFTIGGGLVTGNSVTGAEFLSGLGTEFFVPGLESIGFSFELGAALTNLPSGSFVLKTYGATFLDAGVHFYF